MKVYNKEGREINLNAELIKKVLDENPKMLFIVNPNGDVKKYILRNGHHHYIGYVDYAIETGIIDQLDDDIQKLIYTLLVDNKLMNRLNLNESEQKELSNAYYKIRKMLIKNGYFIMESFVNEYDLKQRYVMTPLIKCNNLQRKTIMNLFFKYNLDSFKKTSKNDNEGIILEKYLLEGKEKRVSM